MPREYGKGLKSPVVKKIWTNPTISYVFINMRLEKTNKTIANGDVGRTGLFWHIAGKMENITGFVGIYSGNNY